MKALILERLKELSENLITEETFTDLFEFLEQDPRKMTMGTAYYVHSMDSYMNKNIVGADGVKIPNPMYGKLYKNTRFTFRWADTYGKAVERTNPEHEMGQRSGSFERVQGYDVLETGKSGLYLPIIPTGTESSYSVFDENGWNPISKDEVYQYLRPVSPSSGGSGVNFRPLIIDKVAKLTGGGNVWNNPNFKGKYLGPGTV